MKRDRINFKHITLQQQQQQQQQISLGTEAKFDRNFLWPAPQTGLSPRS